MAETAAGPRGGGTVREPNYASQGVLSCCSREHAVVKANFSACRSAATVCYLLRPAHDLAAQPENAGHGEFVVAGRLALRKDRKNCGTGAERITSTPTPGVIMTRLMRGG
jgi:hypothetical protein